jgi:hypothetical protein
MRAGGSSEGGSSGTAPQRMQSNRHQIVMPWANAAHHYPFLLVHGSPRRDCTYST